MLNPNPLQQDAKEFRDKFGLTPGLSSQSLTLQARLIAEESREVAEAVAELQEFNIYSWHLRIHLLKELADLVYVCFQMAEAFGWDLGEACLRVHNSNLSKLGLDGQPIRDQGGKVLKGPNYQEPDLSDLV
jgi:NTP pyrophosphatase (non-canonical NTP hydrolase)